MFCPFFKNVSHNIKHKNSKLLQILNIHLAKPGSLSQSGAQPRNINCHSSSVSQTGHNPTSKSAKLRGAVLRAKPL